MTILSLCRLQNNLVRSKNLFLYSNLLNKNAKCANCNIRIFCQYKPKNLLQNDKIINENVKSLLFRNISTKAETKISKKLIRTSVKRLLSLAKPEKWRLLGKIYHQIYNLSSIFYIINTFKNIQLQ